jgi:hypothetical protein
MPFHTSACSCYLGSPEEKLATFDSVFLGKVMEIKNKGTTNALNEPEIEVKFEQIKRFKGNDEDIVLDTNLNRSSCTGYWFREEDPVQLEKGLSALEEVFSDALYQSAKLVPCGHWDSNAAALRDYAATSLPVSLSLY